MMNRTAKLLLSLAAVVCAAVLLLKVLPLTSSLLPEKEMPKPTESYRITHTGELVRRDLTNLVETSNLITVVTVVDEPKSFCVRSVNGGDTIFSEQTVKIERVFMGDDGLETVAVRQQGGTVGLRTDYYTENPVLKTESRYLLFLYQPDMGGGYNTEGDYYYIRGRYQGAYEAASDGTYRQSYGPKLTDADLTEAIANGPDKPYSSRREYLATQERNYLNGHLTKEGYEQNIARLDDYAVIIPDTEASWY